MRRGRRVLAVLMVTMMACMVFSSLPVAAISSGYTGNGNNLDLSLLQPGDIIAVSGVVMGGLFDVFVPGHFTHVAMYIGNGLMVEAWKSGVRVISVTEVHKASDAAIYRVATSDRVRQAAVNWALTKVGYPYDYIWLTYIGGKQVYGSRYYCSELIWAAYKAVGGPDIDQNPGWSWKYGYNVAPQEICDDGDTYLVAYSS
ncbi:MAG: YiiX/YebB-like N1pC/P60 family cysteine hydrolase [Candidatus Freyarchaeota archaeon]|nr:YiiX/YebB-like N1pC/P60 family cysteine hydrolase [Candidatus Freyrarchaeum guaymaensis]